MTHQMAPWDGHGRPHPKTVVRATWKVGDMQVALKGRVLIKGYHYTKNEPSQVWFATRQGQDIVAYYENCLFEPLENDDE